MTGAPRGARSLVPLYVASAVLTVGEGSFGLLVPPYLDERHLSEIAIGTALAAYGVVSLLTRIPVGAVYRSHRAWPLIAFGCVLSSLSFAGLTQTDDPLALTLLVALDGAGFAIASTANMAALLDRRPPGANAGSIMGWYTGGLGAGYAVAGFLGGSLGDALGISSAILVLSLVPLIAGALLSLVLLRTAPDGSERAAPRVGHWLRDFRYLPPLVWLAFFVTLYLNLVSGVVLTFFPIYGLAIGLTLTQVGLLVGLHGAAAATVRFLSGIVFRWVSYERALPVMIVVSGLSVALIGGVQVFLVLAVGWVGLGLARGLLRVASAALVMDEAGETDGRRGAASSVYLSGLDFGRVLGPLVGGLGAHAVGLRATFLIASVSFPVVYFVLAALLSRHGSKRPGEPGILPVTMPAGEDSRVEP